MAVKIPFTINPMLDMAPKAELISIDFDVPTAWAAVHIEIPCAIGFFTRVNFMIPYPKIAPKMPTTITTEAVSGGIPPIDLEISMAIGVVTDFGASEKITSLDAPISLAISTTETTPAMQPANCETRIGIACFLIFSNCKYNGTPNATTAGFRKNSISRLPLWNVS